jgi:hypothetical protein
MNLTSLQEGEFVICDVLPLRLRRGYRSETATIDDAQPAL